MPDSPSVGQLVFDSAFESGNMGEVTRLSPLEYDVAVRPDTLNGKYRLWFYFSVRNMVVGQKVLLNIVGFSKGRSLYREGMAPVVRSTSRPKWERLPEQAAFYYRSARHDGAYALSLPFAFDRAETYWFAYCYPYTYTALQQELTRLDALNLPHYRRECLCATLEQRRLDLLTIGSPALLARDPPLGAAAADDNDDDRADPNGADAPPRVPVVFVSARVHPGESPSSFVAHGLIAFLLSDEPLAAQLRGAVLFKIVPMLNPDGVARGNYRCSSLGIDLNRQWRAPEPSLAPTVAALKALMCRYASAPASARARWRPSVWLDVHAHSTVTNGFLFCNSACLDVHAELGAAAAAASAERRPAADVQRAFEREAAFPRALGAACADIPFASAKFCADPAKAGTGRRALCEALRGAHVFTLEVSFFGARRGGAAARGGGGNGGAARPAAGGPPPPPSPSSSSRIVPYTQAGYVQLGVQIGHALYRYHCSAATPATPECAPASRAACASRSGARTAAVG